MSEFWHTMNPIFRFFSLLMDLIILNFLTVLCCIPIFTIGAGLTANHRIAQNMVLHEELPLCKTFFRTFRSCFKQATSIWLFGLFVFLVLLFNLYLAYIYFSGLFAKLLLCSLALLLCMVLGILAYVFPLIARYHNTILEFLSHSFYLFVVKLPISLVLIVLNIIPITLFLFQPYIFLNTLYFWATLGLSLIAYLQNLILKKTFLQLELKRDSALEH